VNQRPNKFALQGHYFVVSSADDWTRELPKLCKSCRVSQRTLPACLRKLASSSDKIFLSCDTCSLTGRYIETAENSAKRLCVVETNGKKTLRYFYLVLFHNLKKRCIRCGVTVRLILICTPMGDPNNQIIMWNQQLLSVESAARIIEYSSIILVEVLLTSCHICLTFKSNRIITQNRTDQSNSAQIYMQHTLYWDLQASYMLKEQGLFRNHGCVCFWCYHRNDPT
jgi:hypothetical protein